MECPNELAKFLPWVEESPLCAPTRRFILTCGSAAVPPGHFLYLANDPPAERELRQPLAFVRNECCLYILSVSVPPRAASAAVHLIQYSHKPISNLFCILITLISNDNQHKFTVYSHGLPTLSIYTSYNHPHHLLSPISYYLHYPWLGRPPPTATGAGQLAGKAIVWSLCISMQSFDYLSLVKICDFFFSNCSVH